ncbi:MAG TPA: hypothetical protein VKU41_21610 [Polyangiaceae bacterium]|nr:hypothetical protein [Polyangiaceae bacterium]
MRITLARHAAVSGRSGSLVALVVATGLVSCSRCDDSAAAGQAARDFGATGADVPEAAAYLAMARAIVEGRGRAAATAAPLAPGRRAFLAYWPAGGGEAIVGTGVGPALADAVAAAANGIAPKVPSGATGRLELDVATSRTAEGAEVDDEVPLSAIGLEGLLSTRDDGRTGFVLPGEVVEKGLFHTGKKTGVDRSKAQALVADRAGVPVEDLAAMRPYRFSAGAWVETPTHDGALPVMRGMVKRPLRATPEALIRAVGRGADYLARVMNDEGRYVYVYHPVEDRDDASYGWLRHAGTTYALLEAYDEFGTPLYRQKAERALAYLSARLRDDPASQGKYLQENLDEEQQKSGGAGLALLAFAEHAAVTGSRQHLETMRALARFIVAQQYADGHFRSNVDVERETGQKTKREVIYYTGEAVLGLMRLYAIDSQAYYLDAARKAADWVIQVRDSYVSEENQEHDHWMSYAFNELYRAIGSGAYLEHAYKIARAIQQKQRSAADAPAPDLVATFYDGQTTPAATRLEAYDADAALSRFAGKPDAWLLGPAQEVAAAMLGQQFSADNDYWLKNPAKAEGGVRESLFVQDVRIDYVQHSMSAWLHLARLLRDPGYGKTGVPSQDPVRSADAGAPAR